MGACGSKAELPVDPGSKAELPVDPAPSSRQMMGAFNNLPVDLVIVRHGQSEANMMIEMTKRGDASAQAAMKTAKRHDSEMRLTDNGREQARMVGKWLKENAPKFDAFYCSQYVRTKETAAEMNLPNANWHADLMIRERDQGVQDGGGDVKLGLTEEEQFRMEKSTLYWQPVAGESMADVVVRVRHFLETLSQCSAGMSVVVVCHYRTIHAFRILLEEIPQEETADLLKETMPNCCIWWYSRRDLENAHVHGQVASVKRIAVQPDGSAEIMAMPVKRKIFTNAALKQQIASVPQVVNNGANGQGVVVKSGAPVDVSGVALFKGQAAPTKNKEARKSMTGQVMPAGALADLTSHESLMTMPLTVVVFGATGDLAKKKLFPALYQLCLLDHIPRHVNILGYGRSAVDLPAFIAKQCVNIKEDPRLSKADFCARIGFHAGGYDAAESYQRLHATMSAFEVGKPGNRLYFLSVPPTIFGAVTAMISAHSRAMAGGFTRLMVEKPFGRDSATFEDLNKLTATHFNENQLFRLDHYLGKEVILNIATLRWSNQFFEPAWNAQHIESVQLTFKENLGTGGRGGYFDGFGIIRDIIQNHLLQAFMWLAMEPPKTMTGPDITQAKVDLLSKVPALDLDNKESVFLGQFARHGDEPGYLEDETVPPGSKCPTFASCVLHVDSDRWRGVPFLFTAGKGMGERVCELRIRYKAHSTNLIMGVQQQNELVMRVQPDESVYMVTIAKEPGITAEQLRKPVVMDMAYATQFKNAYVGDAYERMFLNAAHGDQALFVSAPELVEAWRIFTPLLHQIDERKPEPLPHPFGCLPDGYMAWAHASGVEIRPTWQEFVASHGDKVNEMRKIFDELDINKNGTLDFNEITSLAKRFFDGREPKPAQVKAIFGSFDDKDGDKDSVTFDEFLEGVQRMNRSFHTEDMDDTAMHHEFSQE